MGEFKRKRETTTETLSLELDDLKVEYSNPKKKCE